MAIERIITLRGFEFLPAVLDPLSRYGSNFSKVRGVRDE